MRPALLRICLLALVGWLAQGTAGSIAKEGRIAAIGDAAARGQLKRTWLATGGAECLDVDKLATSIVMNSADRKVGRKMASYLVSYFQLHAKIMQGPAPQRSHRRWPTAHRPGYPD